MSAREAGSLATMARTMDSVSRVSARSMRAASATEANMSKNLAQRFDTLPHLDEAISAGSVQEQLPTLSAWGGERPTPLVNRCTDPVTRSSLRVCPEEMNRQSSHDVGRGSSSEG